MSTNTAVVAMLKEADKRTSDAIGEALMYRAQCREVERQWEAALLARDLAITRAIVSERHAHAANAEAARLREALENLRAYVSKLEAQLEGP